MNPRALFGINAALSLLGAATLAGLYLWPLLRSMDRERALTWLVAPHTLLRFIGLSFLVPGVVSPALPRSFAGPAAYGDLVAGLLAVVTTIALSKRARGAVLLAWIFNLWGAADLLVGFFEGGRAGMTPGALGAAYFLPTAVVPLLLVSHFLAFRLLVRRAGPVAGSSEPWPGTRGVPAA